MAFLLRRFFSDRGAGSNQRFPALTTSYFLTLTIRMLPDAEVRAEYARERCRNIRKLLHEYQTGSKQVAYGDV